MESMERQEAGAPSPLRRMARPLALAALAALAVAGQIALASRRPASAPALSEGAFAALGGLRSIPAEVIWFRADRLQDEGRYVELAQLASMLTFMEPHTPEVWSYAAWNLAYNISVMMPTDEDRWRWVEAGLRLLRDEGLKYNPSSKDILRELAWMFEIKIGASIDSAAPELAWMFEIKIGASIDSAAPVYRAKWKAIVEDVKSRGAWHELGMNEAMMRRIEQATGFDDWTDPQLSAIYWGARGGCRDIVTQASILYRKNHSGDGGDENKNTKAGG